jgi:hypothetical protein
MKIVLQKFDFCAEDVTQELARKYPPWPELHSSAPVVV